MTHLIRFFRSSSLVLPSRTAVIAQTPPRVTPMTPDVVEKYDQTLPSADYVRREVMVPMRDGSNSSPSW